MVTEQWAGNTREKVELTIDSISVLSLWLLQLAALLINPILDNLFNQIWIRKQAFQHTMTQKMADQGIYFLI